MNTSDINIPLLIVKDAQHVNRPTGFAVDFIICPWLRSIKICNLEKKPLPSVITSHQMNDWLIPHFYGASHTYTGPIQASRDVKHNLLLAE